MFGSSQPWQQDLNNNLDAVSQHLERIRGVGGDPLPSRVLGNLEDVQRQMQERTLQRMLETVQDLDEEQLYAEIERGEEALRNQLQSRRDAEATLRAEVERLAVDVAILQKSTSSLWHEAENIGEVEDKVAHRRQEEASATKRQVVITKRNTDFARKIYNNAKRHQEQTEALMVEIKFLEEKGAERRDVWEVAVQAAHRIARRVQELEKEKARLDWEMSERVRDPNMTGLDIENMNAEAQAMRSEQQALMKELRRAEDAQELKKLLDSERAANSKKRLTTAVLIEEIAELEESADHIERRSQAMIEELRIALERGASQAMELQHQKQQAEEWVRAMWSTICQQKREQLMLHQRMKEEDNWTEHLQQRTDALVEELRVLEEDVRGYEGPVGATERERQLEEDMFKRLQKSREKRRHAQHQLALHLSRRKPLLEALRDAQEDQRVLNAKLEPVRGLMGTSR
mmetsp:Transcript_44793/g.84209  ORF Transcript_44793/g.84209 Transcript_44793/m.84209 type:complete len:459 (+) Transcript_44793:179-1555(+)